MTYTPVVDPSTTFPTHHLTLSDGVNTIGLTAVNSNHEPDIKALSRTPYPKSTLKVEQGNGDLSANQSPYGEFSRETFIGGIGFEEASADSTAYWFGKNIWTLADGRAMLGPKTMGSPSLGSLSNTGTEEGGADVGFQTSYYQFKVTAAYKISSLTLRLSGYGTAYVKMFSDSSGPATLLNTYTLTITDYAAYHDYTIENINYAAGTYWFRVMIYGLGYANLIAYKTNATFTAQATQTATISGVAPSTSGASSGSTPYTHIWTFTIAAGKEGWKAQIISDYTGPGNSPGTMLFTLKKSGVTVYQTTVTITSGSYPGDGEGPNHIYVPYLAEAGSYTAEFYVTPNTGYTVELLTGGVFWMVQHTMTASVAPVFTLTYTEDNGGVQGEYFEYKGCLYYVTEPVTGQSKLFINCDRGAADSNSGQLTKLIDATKSWAADAYIGCVVKITGGPGAGEWRKVTDNDGTSLTVSPAWETTHTTSTEYVIKGANIWTEIGSTGFSATYPVKDVDVSNYDVVYFSQGQSAYIQRMREYNNSGTWTREFAADATNTADLLCTDWDQTKKGVIWKAVNTTPPILCSGSASAWGTSLTFPTADNVQIGDSSPIKGIVPYDGKVAVTKNAEIWLVKNNLPEKLSINMGSRYEEYTGRNPMVYSPYLIFPYGNGIERMVGQIVEDFTPKMPISYSGQFMDSFAIPGAIISARRGVNVSGIANNSMILIWRNGAWHPFYSIDTTYQVFDVYYQRIDSGDDILWFSATTGILGIRFPREWDYLKDPAFQENGYEVSSEGYLVTGWFNAGSKRLSKWWESIYVAMDTVGAGSGAGIAVYYQTQRYLSDTDISAWTYAGSLSASGEINLRIESREVRFRFVLTGNATHVPILLGYNVEYIGRVDAADNYVVPILIADRQLDLVGKEEDANAHDKMTILDAWSRSVVPLTMRSVLNVFDNKRVVIDRAGLRPVSLNTHTNSDLNQGRECYYGNLIIYEVA